MQALSQLSYGPALLRAGNHIDISHPWEVFCAKSFLRDCPSSMHAAWRAVRPPIDTHFHLIQHLDANDDNREVVQLSIAEYFDMWLLAISGRVLAD